jgi:hypothetical protein
MADRSTTRSGRGFYPVLRKLGIRLRDFYSTRDTFISEMIHRGENLKAIAKYCGTSVAMIAMGATSRRTSATA